MKKITIAICLIILSGCHKLGPEKTEKGYVVEKQYFPDTRQTITGTGISTNGEMVMTSHNIGSKEKYMVIFKCEHGVIFSVNNIQSYGTLEKGDSVKIHFKECRTLDSEIVDYDFIYASKLRN
jgi:hypothetical protein